MPGGAVDDDVKLAEATMAAPVDAGYCTSARQQCQRTSGVGSCQPRATALA
jgi:hypothetical protein